MDTTLDPRWQAAVHHSRYLANLLQAHPELIPELLATWEQPFTEAMLQAPLRQEFANDDAVRTTQIGRAHV